MSDVKEDLKQPSAGNGSKADTQDYQEQLPVKSGYVLLIDQFMLSNQQFLERVKEALSENGAIAACADELRAVVERYGGCLIELPAASYKVFRDAQHSVMLVYPETDGELAVGFSGEEPDGEGPEATFLLDKKQYQPSGSVSVDTRCVVFIDANVLASEDILAEYRSLRLRGKEKNSRDFLRTQGATVRYGFARYGDELNVFRLDEPSRVGLWPESVAP